VSNWSAIVVASLKAFVSRSLQTCSQTLEKPFLKQIKSGLWPTRLFRHIAGSFTALLAAERIRLQTRFYGRRSKSSRAAHRRSGCRSRCMQAIY
jgi:hypothetical protein